MTVLRRHIPGTNINIAWSFFLEVAAIKSHFWDGSGLYSHIHGNKKNPCHSTHQMALVVVTPQKHNRSINIGSTTHERSYYDQQEPTVLSRASGTYDPMWMSKSFIAHQHYQSTMSLYKETMKSKLRGQITEFIKFWRWLTCSKYEVYGASGRSGLSYLCYIVAHLFLGFCLLSYR